MVDQGVRAGSFWRSGLAIWYRVDRCSAIDAQEGKTITTYSGVLRSNCTIIFTRSTSARLPACLPARSYRPRETSQEQYRPSCQSPSGQVVYPTATGPVQEILLAAGSNSELAGSSLPGSIPRNCEIKYAMRDVGAGRRTLLPILTHFRATSTQAEGMRYNRVQDHVIKLQTAFSF